MNQPEKKQLEDSIIEGNLKYLENISKLRSTWLTEPLDGFNHSSIHIAIRNKQFDAAKLLLDAIPALLESRNYFGETPLLLAAQTGDLDFIIFLCNRGARILNIHTNCPYDAKLHNRTIIDWARVGQYGDCVEFLLHYQTKAIKKRIQNTPSKYQQSAFFYDLGKIALDDQNIDAFNFIIHQERLTTMQCEQLFFLVMSIENPTTLHAILDSTGLMDVDPYKLIETAIIHDKSFFIDELFNRGIDPNHQLTTMDVPSQQINLLEFAIRSSAHRCIKLLMVRLFSETTKESILKYITSAIQALDIAALSPALYKAIHEDSRLMSLIEKASFWRPSSFGLPACYAVRKQNRPHSFLAQWNTETRTLHFSTPTEVLGSGTYGLVRTLEVEGKKPLCVKSVQKDIDTDFEQEAKIMSALYANKGPSQLFNYGEDQRLVMPLIRGKAIHSFIETLLSSPTEKKQFKLASLILATASSLHQIHERGYVHGDIKENNIIVRAKADQFKVHFIDFGLTETINEPRAPCLPSNKQHRYAPERISTALGKTYYAHTNQDVYSLGMLLDILLKANRMEFTLLAAYPSIDQFIKNAKSKTPKERPLLIDFINQLTSELNQSQSMKDQQELALAEASCSYQC